MLKNMHYELLKEKSEIENKISEIKIQIAEQEKNLQCVINAINALMPALENNVVNENIVNSSNNENVETIETCIEDNETNIENEKFDITDYRTEIALVANINCDKIDENLDTADKCIKTVKSLNSYCFYNLVNIIARARKTTVENITDCISAL